MMTQPYKTRQEKGFWTKMDETYVILPGQEPLEVLVNLVCKMGTIMATACWTDHEMKFQLVHKAREP
jgi:hypothetical protein